MITNTRHVFQYRGSTFNDRDTDTRSIYRISYGLVSVYADRACNYSYREFWF